MVQFQTPRIVVDGSVDSAIGRFSATELARYLTLLGAAPLPLVGLPAGTDDADLTVSVQVVLRVDGDLPPQGYRLRAGADRTACLEIAGGDGAGVLYGVYALLETFGMGFYNGGDTFPDLPTTLTLPDDFECLGAPAFRARGNMLHYNFLCGPTCWGLDDYRFYFDQLARQRMNVLLMHWYDGEPGVGFEQDGRYYAGGATPSALAKPWGAVAAWRTSEYAFDTGRWFDEEVFNSPLTGDFPHLLVELRRSEAMFREATAYALGRAVQVAAGFEAPGAGDSALGDPTDAATMGRFRARVRQFLARNPDLTYFALWQHESGGCVGSTPPAPGTAAAALLATHRADYAMLGDERRVWEAIRFGEFARAAAEEVDAVGSDLRLVVVGWGGDRWMRFADYCLIYDRVLPKSVVFCCHDNIDASMGPNVSTAWGELPPERERWAMPWVEGDVDDCWTRQPHVESLGLLAPDALAKGCQGLLNLQWRTRDVEEENAFIAQFAWDPGLTPDRFYARLALHTCGPALPGGAVAAPADVALFATLQRLGARWTGVRGAVECGRMHWTGWEPPFPTELDDAALAQLEAGAANASSVLAEVPAHATDGDGAFHLQKATETVARRDPTRLGVAEFAGYAARLHALRTAGPVSWRSELWEIHEAAYACRAVLVQAGMPGAGYRAVDEWLFRLHHVLRVAGAAHHRQVLDGLRAHVRTRTADLCAAGRLDRVERLDFLAATIDFVQSFDAVALLLRSTGDVAQAIAALPGLEGSARTECAANAWTTLIAAGMRDALLAQTRKLTTRGEWGVLTTVNTKPLPLYLDALAALARAMPVAPPLMLRGVGLEGEIGLSWDAARGAVGYHLYRRPAAGGDAWERLTTTPILAVYPRLYLDRPTVADAWEYAATAVGADGWESPKSHPASADCRTPGNGPRIAAAKPPSHHLAGMPLQQRVVLVGDRTVADVCLYYRYSDAGALGAAGAPDAPGEWTRLPMWHACRSTWQGTIPGAELRSGVLHWYVEALDDSGGHTRWPASAALDLPWSCSVT